MAHHLSLGKLGEDLAAAYLLKRGFKILHRNWRSGHCEIDIIATRDNILHFVEVKTRSSLKYGYPEEAVDAHKIERIGRAISEFRLAHPKWEFVQLDILSILMKSKEMEEYLFIENIEI